MSVSVREGQTRAAELTSPLHHATHTVHGGDCAARCCGDLSIGTGPAGNSAMVRLAGDIDTLALPHVWTALITALDHRPADLVVDMSEEGFCGVRGFAALGAIARVAKAGGIGYTITGLGRHHERPTTLAWSDSTSPIPAVPPAAAAAIRGDQADGSRPPPTAIPAMTSSRSARVTRQTERCPSAVLATASAGLAPPRHPPRRKATPR